MDVVKYCVQPKGSSYLPLDEDHPILYPRSSSSKSQTTLQPLPLIPLLSAPLSVPYKSMSKLPSKAWTAESQLQCGSDPSRNARKKVSSAFRLCVDRKRQFRRIKDLEDSCDLSSQFQTSVNIGDHAFSHMEEDIDRQRLLGGQPSYTRVDPETASMTSDLQKKERYERLLRRAKTEDLREISGIGCLYQCGVDKFGRPVVVFIGKWFKFNEINLDKALLYLIYLLDPLVESDYIIIYFHTITTTENHPSMAWIRQVYDVLQYKHKKNLKSFYIIHPTFWTKIMTWWFTTFMAPQIKHKVHSLPGVEYLYDIIEPDQLEIPAYIIEHDMTVNGIRYYRPASS